MKHVSVLLDESIDMLNIKNDGIYVDCTLGRGGHSEQILKDVLKVTCMLLTLIRMQLRKAGPDLKRSPITSPWCMNLLKIWHRF